MFTRIYNTLLFAAVVGLGVGYYYEAQKNAQYESGEIVSAQSFQAARQAVNQEDWIDAVQIAGE